MLSYCDNLAWLEQSEIRAATRRCLDLQGINLAQGICDLGVPDIIERAASEAIRRGKNVYSASEGVKPLREAVGEKISAFNRVPLHKPEEQVMITHGATGAFVCAVRALFNPGDEVILFEPFYGYHHRILHIHELVVRTIPLSLEDYSFDWDALKQLVTPKTKGIVVCTPHNPTGKVFTREELQFIGALAEEHHLWIISDEIYEYITFPSHDHVSIGSLNDFHHQTITISGFSKTYSMTGWRLGYAYGPSASIHKMSMIQDLLYVCPNTPLQYALLAGLQLPPSYYRDMQQFYLKQRDLLADALSTHGFTFPLPQGAYYFMVNCDVLNCRDDQQASDWLLEQGGVATVPGRAFFIEPSRAQCYVRVCFAVSVEKLQSAVSRLQVFMQKRERES